VKEVFIKLEVKNVGKQKLLVKGGMKETLQNGSRS
jgi:hypothetical protein